MLKCNVCFSLMVSHSTDRKKSSHGQMFGVAGGLPPNLGYAAMGPSQLVGTSGGHLTN